MKTGTYRDPDSIDAVFHKGIDIILIEPRLPTHDIRNFLTSLMHTSSTNVAGIWRQLCWDTPAQTSWIGVSVWPPK